MKHKFYSTVLGIFICLLAMTACNDEAEVGTLQLKLDQKVGQDEMVFDQLIYDAPNDYTFSVITLRYYISRIKIRSKTGTSIDLAEVIYRDAREADTEIFLFEDIPNGEYTSLEFIFGLDEVANVDGGLENTLENINMEWPIPGDQGYHYMKFEGRYDLNQSGSLRSFNLHTGATGGNQNYISVTLPLSSLILNGNDWEIELTMDVLEWLQNPQTYDFETFGPAIMMNQAAQEILKANGSTVFSVTSVNKQ